MDQGDRLGGKAADRLDALAVIVGAGNLLSDRQDTARYLSDWSGDHHGATLAVVRPGTVAEVQALVQACARLHLALIPQGGNTGLVGGAFADMGRGSVILSLDRLNQIIELNADAFTARVEAGCTLQRLKDAAAAVGLSFPLALGAQGTCQIGGNAATNAGGINVLSHGMMRDQILGLQVVLPDGTLWSAPHGLRKDNRGIDLRQLFIGSEGVLGVITEVEVKLVPAPGRVETAYVGLGSFADALRLFGVARRGCAGLLTAFEVIGVECLPLARRIHRGLAAPVSETLPVHAILEVSTPAGVDARALLEAVLVEALDTRLVGEAVVAQSGSQSAGFWAIREGLVEGQAQRGYHVRTDLSVPLAKMPALVDAARALVAGSWPDWTGQAYGHAGDGNLHFNVLPPEDMPRDEARETGATITAALFALATEAGGSISAEHGIGRSRAGQFWHDAPEAQRRLIRAVKAALDPAGMMNPGCMIPTEEGNS